MADEEQERGETLEGHIKAGKCIRAKGHGEPRPLSEQLAYCPLPAGHDQGSEKRLGPSPDGAKSPRYDTFKAWNQIGPEVVEKAAREMSDQTTGIRDVPAPFLTKYPDHVLYLPMTNPHFPFVVKYGGELGGFVAFFADMRDAECYASTRFDVDLDAKPQPPRAYHPGQVMNLAAGQLPGFLKPDPEKTLSAERRIKRRARLERQLEQVKTDGVNLVALSERSSGDRFTIFAGALQTALLRGFMIEEALDNL